MNLDYEIQCTKRVRKAPDRFRIVNEKQNRPTKPVVRKKLDFNENH